MSRERVALTGIGVLCGLGHDPKSFADAIESGRSAVGPVTRFDTSTCRSHLAAELDDFDPEAYIAPEKLRRIDEVSGLAVAASKRALLDAALTVSDDNRHGIGVVLGSSTAGLEATAEYLEGLMLRGPMHVTPMIFSNTVGNAPASLSAIELGLHGPNVTVNHREASSFGAIVYALELLRTGKAEALLAGGVDRLTSLFYRVHDHFRALSPGEGEGSDEGARPFDRRRNGIVLGEGGYVLVLEPWERAESRGARIYAEILGAGATTSRAGRNDWPEEEDGLSRAMEAALEEAARGPGDVSWVLASANGTDVLDRTEARALARVFGPRGVPVASLKGALGQSSSSGAASLAGAALALGRTTLPPTAGFEEGSVDCPVDVSSTKRESDGTVVLVNDFARGGTNYSIVLQASPS